MQRLGQQVFGQPWVPCIVWIYYFHSAAAQHFSFTHTCRQALFIIHYEKNCKSLNGKLRDCWDSRFAMSLRKFNICSCGKYVPESNGHYTALCSIGIKSSLGLTGDVTFEWHKNLVFRLNLTADKQLNPVLPVLLRDAAVMCNHRAAQCFQWPCLVKREPRELLVLLILSHVNRHAVSVPWILLWFKPPCWQPTESARVCSFASDERSVVRGSVNSVRKVIKT